MNDHDTKTPDNDAANGDDLAHLYRATATVEPPPHLDAAIRAAARRELTAPVVIRPPRWQRWSTSLAAAALLVLAVGVVMQLQRETPTSLTSAPEVAQSARPRPAPPALTLEKAAPVTEGDTTGMAAELAAKKELGRRRVRDDAVADYQAQPGPKLTVEGKAATPGRARARMPDQDVLEEQLPTATAASPDREAAPQALSGTLSGAAPAQPMLTKEKAAVTERKTIAESSTQSRKPASALPQTEPLPDSGAARTRNFALDAASDRVAPAPLPAETAKLDTGTAAIEDRLQRIAALLQAHKLPEAERQLRAFRNQYADYPLPKLRERFGRQWVDATLEPPSK